VTSRTIRLAVAALGALVLGTLAAPAAGAQQGQPAYLGLASLNPLGIPFNIFSAEIEGAVAQGFSIAGNGSYTDIGRSEPRWTSFEVKGRYYPQEVALSGFSIGLGLGVLKYSDEIYGYDGRPAGEAVRVAHTSPTISIYSDYNWLLGAERRFLVGAGVGAKRVLNQGDIPDLDVPRAYPMARFTIGIAF
jgi:hypothetical protein